MKVLAAFKLQICYFYQNILPRSNMKETIAKASARWHNTQLVTSSFPSNNYVNPRSALLHKLAKAHKPEWSINAPFNKFCEVTHARLSCFDELLPRMQWPCALRLKWRLLIHIIRASYCPLYQRNPLKNPKRPSPPLLKMSASDKNEPRSPKFHFHCSKQTNNENN